MQEITNRKVDALSFGIDYKVSDKLIIHQPNLREIRSYGLDKYIHAVMMLTSRPYDYMVLLYDMGVDFRKLDDFIYFSELIVPSFDKELSLMLLNINLQDYILLGDSKGNPVLYNGLTEHMITKDDYMSMVHFVRNMHFFPEDTEYHIGNDITYEFIIKRERRKLKKLNKKPKEEYTLLNDMVSFLLWCSNSSYTFDTIQNLTIYQIYEGVRRVQANDKFATVTSGIYNGTVDSSKLDFSTIDPLRHFTNNERKTIDD